MMTDGPASDVGAAAIVRGRIERRIERRESGALTTYQGSIRSVFRTKARDRHRTEPANGVFATVDGADRVVGRRQPTRKDVGRHAGLRRDLHPDGQRDEAHGTRSQWKGAQRDERDRHATLTDPRRDPSLGNGYPVTAAVVRGSSTTTALSVDRLAASASRSSPQPG